MRKKPTKAAAKKGITIIGVPLPSDTVERLDKIADGECRPRANMARQLLTDAMAKYVAPKREALL